MLGLVVEVVIDHGDDSLEYTDESGVLQLWPIPIKSPNRTGGGVVGR